MSKTYPDIAWAIPCLNEEVAIGSVIRDIQKAAPQTPIYVFDNGSTDSTASLAKNAGAIVISVPQRGKGFVVKEMFHIIKADVLFMVDGDATYDVSQWRVMADQILKKNADMIVGSRIGEKEREGFHIIRFVGNLLITSTINFLLGIRLKDMLSGFRAFSAPFLSAIEIESHGFDVETELTIQAVKKGFKITEIPIHYRDRLPGSCSKLNSARDGMLIAWRILVLSLIHSHTLSWFKKSFMVVRQESAQNSA